MHIENKVIESHERAKGKINKLSIAWYYDLHGQIIREEVEQHEYDKQEFVIYEQTKKLMDTDDNTVIDEYTDHLLQVGDQKYWIDEWYWDKSKKTLLVEACSGAG